MLRFSGFTRYLALMLTVLPALTACSSNPENPEYQNAASLEALKVPPDLGTLPASEEFRLPQLSSYSKFSDQGQTKPLPLLPSASHIRFQRDGSMQWLELDISVDKLWPRLRQFVQDLGFSVARENTVFGYLETDWQRDRIQVGGWFSSIGKLFEDEKLDSFRVRIERGDKPGQSRMFIAHRGLVEATRTSNGNESEGWQPRESDIEVETELLNRFLVYAGIDEELAVQKLKEVGPQGASLVKSNNKPVIQLAENFARTWRRVGIALDRSGFVVEDRNRSSGVYYIRLPENFSTTSDKSWFSKIIPGKDETEVGKQFLLLVKEDNGNSSIGIKSRSGTPISENSARVILTQLQQQMY